jgi:hypothetical protein
VTRRRAFLAAVAAFALAGGAAAQDPRASAAVAAAREWLQWTDRLDVAGSHQRAGARFRAAMGEAQWQRALAQDRAPRGDVVQRTVVQTAFAKQLPKGPAGDFAMVQFRTAFAKKTVAGETVTLEREPDDRWRVVGYTLQ